MRALIIDYDAVAGIHFAGLKVVLRDSGSVELRHAVGATRIKQL